MAKNKEQTVMYRIELTERQLRLVRTALEEFFRLPLNQWGDLADRLCEKGVDFSQDKPNHEKVFDHYIHTRDAVKEVFQAAWRIMWPFGPPQKDAEQQIAEDMWSTIRHRLFLDSGSKDMWRTDACPPIQWGPEPLPKIEKMED